MTVTRLDSVEDVSDCCPQFIQMSRPAILTQYCADSVPLAKRITVLLQQCLVEHLLGHHPEHPRPASKKHLNDFPQAT